MSESTADQVKLHVLSGSAVAEGRWYEGIDERVCSARLSQRKLSALLSNPLVRSRDDAMQVIGTRGTRVIGRMDLVASELWAVADGRPLEVPILWGSNFYVPPEERKSMMGVMVLMKTATVAPTIGAHGPSQMALPLYEKLKFTKVPLERFILLRGSRSVVRRYLPNPVLGGAARLVADAGLFALGVTNALRRLAVRARPVRVPQMPDEFDETLRAPGPEGSVRGHRSAAWLNWVLGAQFEEQRRHERALYLLRGKGGAMLGYILMKVKFYPTATHRAFPDLTLATLADWQLFDSTSLRPRDVIHAAVAATGDLGADALEVCAAPTDPLLHGLRTLGFLPAGTMSGMWKAGPKSPLAGDRFIDPGRWTLRPGDGENLPG